MMMLNFMIAKIRKYNEMANLFGYSFQKNIFSIYYSLSMNSMSKLIFIKMSADILITDILLFEFFF